LLGSQQKQYADAGDSKQVSSYALYIGIFLTFGNQVITFTMHIVINEMKFYTHTQWNIEFAKTLCFSQFLNGALIPVMLAVVIYPVNSSFGRLFGSGGLIFNQNYVFLVSAFTNPIV
jgi:hypothetical protein